MGRTRVKQDPGIEQEAGDEIAPLSIMLHLDDLISDKTGAVVIQVDGERLEIQLEDWDEILARGIAPEDTRSEHFDVSGMDYVTFANGMTLYFPAGDVHLTLKPVAASKTAVPNMSLFQLIDRELQGERLPRSRRSTPKSDH